MAKDKEREDSKGNRRKTDSVIKNKTNKQQQKKKHHKPINLLLCRNFSGQKEVA